MEGGLSLFAGLRRFGLSGSRVLVLSVLSSWRKKDRIVKKSVILALQKSTFYLKMGSVVNLDMISETFEGKKE